MKNNGRIYEKIKIDSEVLSITSAAGATSQRYSMEDSFQADFIVSVETTNGGFSVVQLMQSSNATGAGTTLASTQIGSSVNSSFSQAKAAIITFGTAATGATGDSFTINGLTFTFTTSTALLGETSNRRIGSTIGSSADLGVDACVTGLTSLINNATWGVPGVVAATISTAALTLTVQDTASTGISFLSSATAYCLGVPTMSQAIISVEAAKLTAGQKFFSLAFGTCTTGTNKAAVTCLRRGRATPTHGKSLIKLVISTS